MQRHVLKSKIAYATLTDCQLFYEGSIGIDLDILEVADILPNEQVDVLNVNNGERLTTYAIAEKRGSKHFILNGPAARKGLIGDKIVIISYAIVADTERLTPKIITLTDV